jgi:hypothetical protein
MLLSTKQFHLQRKHPNMYSANHLTYLTAGDALVRWSPLVEVEAEERMSGDMVGTTSMRCGGGGLARSSDGLAFAGAGVAGAASRPFAARPTAAAAAALRGRPRSSDRGSRRRVVSGSGLVRSSGGVAGAGVAGAASRPFTARPTAVAAWRGRPTASRSQASCHVR